MGQNFSPFQVFEFPASLAVGRGRVTVLADEMQGEVHQDWNGFSSPVDFSSPMHLPDKRCTGCTPCGSLPFPLGLGREGVRSRQPGAMR